MSPPDTTVEMPCQSFPRVSGDEPWTRPPPHFAASFSPRERG